MSGKHLTGTVIYGYLWGEAAPLTGLLYCADCGGKMYVHRVNEDVLLTLVSDTLRAIAEYSKHDRAEFIRTIQETQAEQ